MSPTKDTVWPGSRSAQILAYLAANKRRKFRCFEIAAAIGDTTQPTANECARLARRGLVNRTGTEDRKVPTFYQHRPSVGGSK